jgi:hypothetical protein
MPGVREIENGPPAMQKNGMRRASSVSGMCSPARIVRAAMRERTEGRVRISADGADKSRDPAHGASLLVEPTILNVLPFASKVSEAG